MFKKCAFDTLGPPNGLQLLAPLDSKELPFELESWSNYHSLMVIYHNSILSATLLEASMLDTLKHYITILF